MKNPRPLLIPITLVLAGSLAACGSWMRSSASGSREVLAQGTKLDPSARAQVTYTKDKNQNTDVQLKVSHLAPANQIDSSASNYVVWVQPTTGGEVVPQGALSVDQNLSATLSFITPMNRFRVFVTAESSPTVQTPSRRIVLQTEVDTAH